MNPSLFDAEPSAAPCGGFSISFLEDGPRVTLLPGARDLPKGLLQAVWSGLSEAPVFLTRAIGLRPPLRPYREVQVLLTEGSDVLGEARGLGSGQIRLWVGGGALSATARDLARHEALHLLLSTNLGAGGRWNDPELAFADWIVRGIEALDEPELPRLRSPLPRLLDPLPASREEVVDQIRIAAAAKDAGARVFGPELFAALQKQSGEHAKLRLVEAALGTHYLDEAARLGGAARLRPLLLDDWLLDYENYAPALGHAPSGAGGLWRLSQAGWSADPLVRLSAAAQSLQTRDRAWFNEGRAQLEDEPLVWKNRGRIRVPLLEGPPGARPFPLQSLRAVLRESPHELAAKILEQAAVGAEHFEALALWPRMLARLLAAPLPMPRSEPSSISRVQILAGANANDAQRIWGDARARLILLVPSCAPWIPQVLAPRSLEDLIESTGSLSGSILLVHGAKIDPPLLARSRRLAASLPVRGAIFHEQPEDLAAEVPRLLSALPDFAAPLDPRYREGAWDQAALPDQLSAFAQAADSGTRAGAVSTPLCHLLSMMGLGIEEALYPQASATSI
jgi:hypothetical protein